MRSQVLADLMRGLILFLVHLLPVDGIKMSFASKKKFKWRLTNQTSEGAGLCACGRAAFLFIDLVF